MGYSISTVFSSADEAQRIWKIIQEMPWAEIQKNPRYSFIEPALGSSLKYPPKNLHPNLNLDCLIGFNGGSSAKIELEKSLVIKMAYMGSYRNSDHSRVIFIDDEEFSLIEHHDEKLMTHLKNYILCNNNGTSVAPVQGKIKTFLNKKSQKEIKTNISALDFLWRLDLAEQRIKMLEETNIQNKKRLKYKF